VTHEPAREELLRHAKLYGCDQVYETGAEYLDGSELARLKVELRTRAAEHHKTRKSRPQGASSWYESVPAITAVRSGSRLAQPCRKRTKQATPCTSAKPSTPVRLR
jgi:hypothetical protein